MSEISIKIKGPISKVVKTKKPGSKNQTGSKGAGKAKAKAKPKTKTEAYLEKLKGREYSYNTSPFYDYKTGLQPTYIYRQQTIPQLQQDAKHTDLIKYLEDMKKNDKESQTGKLTYTERPRLTDKGPPVPNFPEESEDEQKTTGIIPVEDVTKLEQYKEFLELKNKLQNTSSNLSKAKTKLEEATERETLENLGLQKINKKAIPSSEYEKRVNLLEANKQKLETQIKDLKKILYEQ